jgi:hypothetical protein
MHVSSLSGWMSPDVSSHADVLRTSGSIKDCADHRSRSPASHSAGLPSHHVLHAVAVEAVSTMGSGLKSVPEDKAWFTGDTTLDFWVLRHILNPAARSGLSLLPAEERKHIIRVCMAKQHSVRSVDNYFQGCVRKSVAAHTAFGGDKDRSPRSGMLVERSSVHRPVSRSASVTESPGRGSTVSDDSLPFSSVSGRVCGSGTQAGNVDCMPPQWAILTTANNAIMAAPPAWARDVVMNFHDKSRMLRSFFQSAGW